jgi:hypothetical protein
MKLLPDYRPENLPEQYGVEPQTAFAQSASGVAA